MGPPRGPFPRPHAAYVYARSGAYLPGTQTRALLQIHGVSAAFARLQKALDNTARPAWGRGAPERLASLQAKFDRRVSDPDSRAAAAALIEEWRQRSIAGRSKLGPDRPVSQL